MLKLKAIEAKVAQRIVYFSNFKRLLTEENVAKRVVVYPRIKTA